jgi:zinc protease
VKRRISLVLVAVLVALPSLAQDTSDFEIPVIEYEKFTLDNGLTVFVHEDHKAPIVAVNLWYHVGSKNEKPGRTGFAHLFEHLMFNGSENFDDDYFQAMAEVGATDLNGTTNSDRTNYFQNVPTSAFDTALWMESDRMGHLLGVVTQEKLDEQRGVVQNEKRQGENQPYAVSYEMITEAVYPKGHPYSWTVIGKMEDLSAAGLEDVHEWFKSYYGAANAVISIAGDVEAETVRERVEVYFGDIPSGPPVGRADTWVAKRTGTIRQRVEDRVPHARIYKVWNVPQYSCPEHDYLELVAAVLADGKTSRFYKRLVYDEQVARNVEAYVSSREIGSLFRIEATAQPGVDLAVVEKAVDEELARLIADGPSAEEVERVKTQYLASFVRGIERIGGFGGKSDVLALGQVYAGDADHYRKVLNTIADATAEDLQRAARDWLSDGEYALEVRPFPDYKVAEIGADRSQVPTAGETAKPKFVALQRAKLLNGLELIVAERHETPLVLFSLIFDAGYAADQFAEPGTARLAMDMLDEGAGDLDALQISERLDMLGSELESGSNLDLSIVSLTALKSKMAPSLDLYADVILNPTFPEKEFTRLQKQQLTRIQSEKARPVQMALRVFPALLYGKGHAYGNPFTGSGTLDSVSDLTRDDLTEFHDTWFRPNNATLVVVGDATMDEIKPRIESLFSSWESAEVPPKNVAEVPQKEQSLVYLIDKPGAQQSMIVAGHVAPPRGTDEDVAIETMNTILGGTFISRLNMNLREDKHWTYGAGTFLPDANGQRPLLAYAPVQTDKTKEAMVEIQKEFEEIRGPRPITDDELAKIKTKKTLELPGLWETNEEVMDSITEIVRFDLDDGYFNGYADTVIALSLDDVNAAANGILYPDRLVWMVVGDREKIEEGIGELELGPIQMIDADGTVVE